ncbi:hypothetical protein C8J30_101106 [Rhodobacter viridis]|uniref:Uncharacterized protein n=1 Tax=Rhodobacter viridis TaxID=1054202 RepID=A0A318UGN3_9RHOB|nr:hypothetical protein [Rhodobacter viridis]PYF12725.1 hypothetical protein C8J30_101106 [Rhodobacter viridis]
MHLIIATESFSDVPLRRIPGGYEAVLAGETLKRLIDASFQGASIEVLGGDLNAHGFDVTDIRMRGATTTVTLMSSGAKALH